VPVRVAPLPISGPLLPPSAMSVRCHGGGSGGGTESLAFGIDIGREEVVGEVEFCGLDLLHVRNRSEWFETKHRSRVGLKTAFDHDGESP
jgi:hypothetical protein